MTTPFAAQGRWISDQRGGGRGVRVSSHVEGGFLVVSTWKEDRCVSTVRLLPDEAAELVAGLAEGLGRLANLSSAAGPFGEDLVQPAPPAAGLA